METAPSALTTGLIYLGAIICVCGVATVRTIGEPQCVRREAIGVWIGSFIAGLLGFYASFGLAFWLEFLPFFRGNPGSPAKTAAVLFAGTALFAWLGTRIGGWWARNTQTSKQWPF